MRQITVIAAHVAVILAVAVPAQTVSALNPPPGREEFDPVKAAASTAVQPADLNTAAATNLTAMAATTYSRADLDAKLAPISAAASSGAAAVPFARTKWAGAALATDTTGSRVIAIPAGRMTVGVTCNITIRTTGAFATPNCVPAGTPSTGYSVTVTFTKLKTAITIPAVVLGAAATTLPVLEPMASTGVVVFDIAFSEPDVVGP